MRVKHPFLGSISPSRQIRRACTQTQRLIWQLSHSRQKLDWCQPKQKSRTENHFSGSTERKPDSHWQPGTKSSKSLAGGTFFQPARAPPQM